MRRIKWVRLKSQPIKLLKFVAGEAWEFELTEMDLKIAESIYEAMKGEFEKYPEGVRWREGGEKTLFIGVAGEHVFDVILDELQIPHIWNRFEIQNAKIKKRKKTAPDFIVKNYTIDVKTSASEEEPQGFLINWRRWRKNPSDIVVFLWIPPDHKICMIYGWIPKTMIPGCEVVEGGYSPAIYVPRYALRGIADLFNLLEKGEGVG